ncbi:hypothetical protein EC991_008550 [Linnemannia zychae]|nr:hypothetical protein EC991_008550 [Linnemannia zychae]
MQAHYQKSWDLKAATSLACDYGRVGCSRKTGNVKLDRMTIGNISLLVEEANMSLFKRSNKNKSASVASTPAQTPRASMQTVRDSGIKMTPEEALYKISHNMMTNASNGPFVR